MKRLLAPLLLLVASLARADVTPTSIDVFWTAPGDDGNVGTATSYDLRYSTQAITASNFSSAARFVWTPAPQIFGTPQSCTVTGLQPGTAYYFAIKAIDEVGNVSVMSNVTSAITPPISDVAPPGKITDLRPGP